MSSSESPGENLKGLGHTTISALELLAAISIAMAAAFSAILIYFLHGDFRLRYLLESSVVAVLLIYLVPLSALGTIVVPLYIGLSCDQESSDRKVCVYENGFPRDCDQESSDGSGCGLLVLILFFVMLGVTFYIGGLAYSKAHDATLILQTFPSSARLAIRAVLVGVTLASALTSLLAFLGPTEDDSAESSTGLFGAIALFIAAGFIVDNWVPPWLIAAAIGYPLAGVAVYHVGSLLKRDSIEAYGVGLSLYGFMVLVPLVNILAPLTGYLALSKAENDLAKRLGVVKKKTKMREKRTRPAEGQKPKPSPQPQAATGAQPLVSATPPPSQPSQPHLDTETQRDLDELLSRGWITREEYEELKKELSQSS